MENGDNPNTGSEERMNKNNDLVQKSSQKEQKDSSSNLDANNIELKVSTEDFILTNLERTLIIFCNPLSGNQEGKIFLNIASKYKTEEGLKVINYQEINGKYKCPIIAVLFNLIDKEDNNRGTELLRKCVNKILENSAYKINNNIKEDDTEKKVIKVLIAGGDGTVLSMIQGFDKKGIDVNQMVVGHVPLGTGNDLSNALGFSNTVNITNNVESLYKILERYYLANKSKVDIWKMELKLDPNNGRIIQNTKNGKVSLTDSDGNIIRTYKRTFINYLSFGYDARVGFNFDPKRTKSRCCNKCVYFWEGLKKNFCRKTVDVPGFLDTFTVYDSKTKECQDTFMSDYNQVLEDKLTYNKKDDEIFNSNEPGNKDNTNTNNNNEKENIKIKYQFKSYKTLSNEEKNDKNILMVGSPCSIICQNIIFYMAGIKDIWGNAKDKFSVKVVNVKNEDKEKEYLNKFKEMAEEKQKMNDKKLEFFTFDNGLETGFEKIFKGHAKKLYHGYGPIEMKFTKTEDLNEKDRKHRIYLNVDGEYFNVVIPISLRIELDTSLCDGQLPFLTRNV